LRQTFLGVRKTSGLDVSGSERQVHLCVLAVVLRLRERPGRRAVRGRV